jgi:hypothetical protein
MISISTSRTEGEEGATKTRYSARAIRLFPPVVDLLKQMKPLRAQPNDYILIDERNNPINQDKFGQGKFQGGANSFEDSAPGFLSYSSHFYLR